MNTPLISIIIPIYNSEKYLRECLDSVQKQSYTDFEVLCVNDGSNDASPAVCEEYTANDNRFHLINQENGGVSKARNTALDIAKGEYLCFVDSDDAIHQDYLSNLLALTPNVDISICDYSRYKEELGGAKTKTTAYEAPVVIRAILNESIRHPNIWMMLFKGDIIRQNKIRFTEGCLRGEDTEFYMKYLTFCKNVIVSDYKGYFYRDNPDSAVHKFDIRSLSTHMDADERISVFLQNAGIVDENNLVVSSSIQYFIYKTAIQRNKEIYEYLHRKYDVRGEMKKMLRFPRLSRRGVAFLYLLLDKKGFYRAMSFIQKG